MATETVVEEHGQDLEKSNWEGGESPFKVSYGKIMMWYFLLSDAFTFSAFLAAYGALRFSMPSWPVPDFVFSTAPFGITHAPLIFVTFMSFVLIISSVTMVRAVQEGHRNNKRGVVFWLVLTIIGGLGFLGCQAWEWNNLINKEHLTLFENPFGTHVESGTYLQGDGHDIKEGDTFEAGESYLIHKHEGYWDPLRYKTETGEVKHQNFGPRAFGGLFFFITGFHGTHVFIGVILLILTAVNAASGNYDKRNNHYAMVEKIGLYWHFVDLVWVFVFLLFYLL